MAAKKKAGKPKTRPVQVVYDGLPEGKLSWVYEEDPGRTVPEARHPAGERYPITGQPTIRPGAVVDVADLNDPRSERARIVRGQLDRGLCSIVEE